jgi:hypothetical protein
MIQEYKNRKGEIILNTNFGNGYGITQRNDKFIAMDLTGEEFEFEKFENVARFVSSANEWNDSRILIYNEIKAMEV